MANSYKILKENFVSNLTGGSVLEINQVTALAPAALTLWTVLQTRHSFFTPYTPAAFITDTLLNVGVILLATTLYSSSPTILATLILAPALPLYILRSTSSRPTKKPSKPPTAPTTTKPSNNPSPTQHTPTSQHELDLDPLPTRPFITNYRGAMLVITCISILAVDFRIFPRRFAKVETWGTSLMDLGVGSFVFSAGLVSARQVLKDTYNGHYTRLSSRLYASARHSLPLLVLGLVRLWSVKGLDYAEHVSEYGVHWNFFFTLGFIPPFVALFQSFFSIVPSYALLSILLSTSYQIVLETTRLKAYVLTAPRTDLLAQNREGVFSFVGYLAIFLAGRDAGVYLLPRTLASSSSSTTTTSTSTTTSPRHQRMQLLLRLALTSALYTILCTLCTTYPYGLNIRISRRLANLPYTLWVSAFNTAQLLLFCLIETFLVPGVHTATDRATERRERERATSRVLKAFNRNGLVVFLLANLVTGAVNLGVETLGMGRLGAMGVLGAYVGLLTGVAVGLDAWNVTVKM